MLEKQLREALFIYLLLSITFAPITLWIVKSDEDADTPFQAFDVMMYVLYYFVVIFFPLSTLLYNLITNLFRKFSKCRRSNSNCPSGARAPVSDNQKNQHVGTKADNPPQTNSSATCVKVITFKTTNDCSLSQRSLPHKLCEFIWFEMEYYLRNTDPALSIKSQLYLWGIFLYVAVKAVKDQRFINDVYSYFDTCAIKRVNDSGHRSPNVYELKQLYRQIREPLNKSHINPVTENGQRDLWLFTKKYLYAYQEPPIGAQQAFVSSVHIIIRLSKDYHSKYIESATLSPVKYSLSESSDSTELPNE